MTADAAVRGIRETDNGNIGIICDESHPPYNRPPLSKALWKGEPLEGIWRNTPQKNLEMMLSRKVVRVDPVGKRVFDSTGEAYTFGKLLLATGGRPRRLKFDPGGIIYYRTLDDYRRLRELSVPGSSLVVIGGGFIGSEIAAALAMNRLSVTMIIPEETIGARVYTPSQGRFLNAYYRERGVDLLTAQSVTGIVMSGKRYAVRTSAGKQVEADGVVAGIGIEPNTELAVSAGLPVDNGIHVDEFLRTAQEDIYAAGDVANFPGSTSAARLRVEHEDNANTMGAIAGRNMAGQKIPYVHLPFFYSDLFDIGYEAVGELDARLETVEDWKVEFREGVVYYMKEGLVRGVLLWNTWGKVDAARELIAGKAPHTRQDLVGLIHS